jgi:hypothetical protein
MEGVRFTDYQPLEDPPPTPPPQTSSSSVVNDEVKAMILALHRKSKLIPQEISKELADIGVKISAVAIESLLVAWNGGMSPQSSPQGSPQPSNQGSPQALTQSPTQPPAQAAHGEMPPWRK